MSVREQAGLLAYSPLACGYLSGKYRNNQLPKGSRIALHKISGLDIDKPNAEKAIEAYYEIAKKYKLDLSTNVFKVFGNSTFCNFCNNWCNYNGAVEN